MLLQTALKHWLVGPQPTLYLCVARSTSLLASPLVHSSTVHSLFSHRWRISGRVLRRSLLTLFALPLN